MKHIRIDGKTAGSILGLTASVIEACNERAPGSQGSLCAADKLHESMSGFCDSVSKETFTMHPGSLFSVGRIIGVDYILSVPLLFWGGVFCYIALCLNVITFAYAFVHYFLYGKLFDRLFKSKAGCNVIGTLEPSGAVKKQIIICGHHDSAYTFNFFSKFEKLAGIRFLLGIFFFLFITAISIIFSVEIVFGNAFTNLNGLLLILALIGLLFTIPLMFFISKNVSPGAGDNLNGSSLAIHTGKYFADKEKEYALQNTRLIILSTDGEEAGQRGAIEYANRHKDELANIPAYVINIDSIYKKSELAVMTRDRHGIVPLSPELAALCLDTASDLGYTARRITFPFGSGTDAAAFAKAGIKAVTIIAMSASLFEEGHVYHTLNDTVENIEPEAVEAVFDIVINTIMKIDNEG